MRYEIGEKVVFIHQLIKNNPRMSNGQPWHSPRLFMPWEHEIEDIRIKVLTVAEHHKVSSEWETDETKKDCDGFIFVDDQHNRWLNQYPHASYGQLSDTADGRVHLDVKKEDEQDVLDGKVEYLEYEDVTRTLGSMLRGVRDLKEHNAHWSEMLQIHIDYVISEVFKKTGATIKVEPLVWEYTDGRKKVDPELLVANLYW